MRSVLTIHDCGGFSAALFLHVFTAGDDAVPLGRLELNVSVVLVQVCNNTLELKRLENNTEWYETSPI